MKHSSVLRRADVDAFQLIFGRDLAFYELADFSIDFAGFFGNLAAEIPVDLQNLQFSLGYLAGRLRSLREKLRGLAVTSAKRVPAYSELPTVAEAGVPGFEVTGWGGLIVPAGTPKSIVLRLNAELNEALALPQLTEKLTSLGSEVAGGTPEQFAELIRKETIKWGDVVKRAGIKID